MSKYISILGIFCLLTNSNLLAGAKGIWAGQSGAFDFQWTTHDVTVSPIAAPSKILYSAARLFRKGHQKTQEAAANEQTLRILSIVGPVMSVETYDYSDYLGTAHPSLYSRYTAIDFRRPDRMARLGDYFPHEDIRMALLRDKLVQKQLRGHPPASTLNSLVHQLADSTMNLAICEYQFNTDMLSRFSFYQIQDDKVAVRLGLSYGSEPCRGTLTQIGLWLPIPEVLRAALEGANRRQEGFLMDSRDIKESLNASDPNAIRNRTTFLQIKGPAHRG